MCFESLCVKDFCSYLQGFQCRDNAAGSSKVCQRLDFMGRSNAPSLSEPPTMLETLHALSQPGTLRFASIVCTFDLLLRKEGFQGCLSCLQDEMPDLCAWVPLWQSYFSEDLLACAEATGHAADQDGTKDKATVCAASRSCPEPAQGHCPLYRALVRTSQGEQLGWCHSYCTAVLRSRICTLFVSKTSVRPDLLTQI